MGLASLLTCNDLHQPEHEEIAHATNSDQLVSKRDGKNDVVTVQEVPRDSNHQC